MRELYPKIQFTKNANKCAYRTKVENMEMSLKMLSRGLQLHKEGKFGDDKNFDFDLQTYVCGTVMLGALHYGMFKSVVELLGSDEQRDYYLPLIQNYHIHGCYAQTEFGHGSDVSMLETIADFDEASDSFVINSPTITSGKYWPGELGKLATHAVFHAQMRIKGESYGVFTFICQIRSIDSHIPLKGIEVGDIGPKASNQDLDNGYLYFNNFVIPRSSLLSKYVQIDNFGNLSVKGNPKFAYATMMRVRANIICWCGYNLNRALLIGTRYSIYRKQFKTLDEGTRERKIIDYQAQQTTFISIFAFSMTTIFMKNTIFNQFNEMMNLI